MTTNLTPTQAALVLNAIPGLGSVTFRRLSDAFDGDLPAVLAAGKVRLAAVPALGKGLAEKIADWQKFFDLEKEERHLAASGARFVPVFDDAFPPLLKKIPEPPIGLYVAGNVAALATTRSVAIVGTRKASLYGMQNAEKIARSLAAAGWTVVSGGARGIDSAAHKGALAAGGGKTVSVFGCGLDIVYPPENFELFKEITANGGALVSEFPFGKKADRRSFPQRNRVIAGIAAGTLVVESDIAGGSIITANFAAELGRSVFALPGRVEQFGSRGCHKLIRDGATLVTSADDLLEDLAGSPIQTLLNFDENPAPGNDGNAVPANDAEKISGVPAADSENFSPEAKKILAALADGAPRTPDELSELLALPFPLVSANLLLLEIDRRVARKADGAYEILL